MTEPITQPAIRPGFAGHGSHLSGRICFECDRLRADHESGAHGRSFDGCPACDARAEATPSLSREARRLDKHFALLIETGQMCDGLCEPVRKFRAALASEEGS